MVAIGRHLAVEIGAQRAQRNLLRQAAVRGERAFERPRRAAHVQFRTAVEFAVQRREHHFAARDGIAHIASVEHDTCVRVG